MFYVSDIQAIAPSVFKTALQEKTYCALEDEFLHSVNHIPSIVEV